MKKKEILGSSFIYFFFSIVNSGISFVTVSFLTHTIKPSEYGIIGIFMSVLYIMPSVVSFSAIGLVQINKVKFRDTEYQKFSNDFISFTLLNYICIQIISIIIYIYVKQYFLLFLFLPVISLVQFLNNFHAAELVISKESKVFGFFNILRNIIMFSFTIFLIYFLNMSWDGRLISILIGESITFYVRRLKDFQTLKKFSFSIDLFAYRKIFVFGLPLLIALGGGWLLNQVDRFLVLKFFSIDMVGIYSAAYSLGMIINVINTSLLNSILPIMYKKLEIRDAYSFYLRIISTFSFVLIILSFVIGGITYFLLPLIFGAEYLGNRLIIVCISLAFGFSGVYRLTGCIIEFYKKNTTKMILVYLSGGINIIFSILFIRRYGILAPAIGTIIAYFVLAIMSISISFKILKYEEKI